MTATDLRFSGPIFAGIAGEVELTFGADDTGGPNATGVVAITLSQPTISFVGITGEITHGTVAATLDDLPALDLAGRYDNAVSRGPRFALGSRWEESAATARGTAMAWEAPLPVSARAASPLIEAQARRTSDAIEWGAAQPSPHSRTTVWQSATSAGTQAASPFNEGVRSRLARSTRFEEGRRTEGSPVKSAYQETIRTSRPHVATRYQEAKPVERVFVSAAQDAQGLVRSWVVPWQEAKHARPGRSVIPHPPRDRCYDLPPAGDVPLVFSARWDGSAELTFICDNHPTTPATVVVPIREVYMVTNEVSLVLASDGTPIPARQFTLSLDYQSWAWSFTARVPKAALALLDFDAGASKTLTATVNGTAFTVVAESADADRSFNSVDVTVRGRGLIAGLCADFAPVLTFTSTEARTAQQLANGALEINGAPLGWTVDWQLTDWLVPAGAWSLQGAYLDALIAIAGAAGGYVQPTATGQTVRILPKFPLPPWNWGSVVPDYEIPSAVATREGLSWTSKPVYNRVFVSGANASGVLGQVTRAGTAGDLVAPMVTDQLITHADAARQRGIAELAPGGRSVLVSLRLPVLPETGVIVPGKFVRYTDVDQRRVGIVRSVAVDVAFPAVFQTVGVETYV